MLEKIYLIDRSQELVNAWKAEFSGEHLVCPLMSDYFATSADAMVSPANSFGIMDGGLDDAIRDRLGDSVEFKVQAKIREQFYGELPIGNTVVVDTANDDWPYLICAPTMRVPEDISHTINPYLAFRAVLVAIINFNATSNKRPIKSIVCSGFGTGVGGVAPEKYAAQMRIALDSVNTGGLIQKISDIHKVHRKLRELA